MSNSSLPPWKKSSFAALTTAGIVFSTMPAIAATYQFYFNNVEQGANSTATPQLQVTQDPNTGAIKVDKTEPSASNAAALPEAAAPTAPALATPSQSPGNTSTNQVAAVSPPPGQFINRWSLGVATSFLINRGYYYREEWAPLPSVGWHPIREVGIHAYLLPTRGFDTAMGGIEASIAPIRWSIGSFQDLIEPRLFAGAWTNFDQRAYASAGASLSLNLSPQRSIDNSFRVLFQDFEQADLVQVTVGLAAHF